MELEGRQLAKAVKLALSDWGIRHGRFARLKNGFSGSWRVLACVVEAFCRLVQSRCFDEPSVCRCTDWESSLWPRTSPTGSRGGKGRLEAKARQRSGRVFFPGYLFSSVELSWESHKFPRGRNTGKEKSRAEGATAKWKSWRLTETEGMYLLHGLEMSILGMSQC